MGNSSPDRTIINVKGMDAAAWEEAKRAANRRGETMGEWLSRACLAQARTEQRDGIIEPAGAANPPAAPPAPAIDLGNVARVIEAMRAANIPIQRRVGAQVNALLYRTLRGGQPALPAPVNQEGPATAIGGPTIDGE